MDFQKATRISSCFLVVVSSALVLASTLWTCSLDDGDNDDASATSSRFTRVLSGASSMPTWEIVLRSGGVIVLVFFSGCFAGLLLALMGPEKNHLLVLKDAGKEEEKYYASKIWEIRQHSNLLLCTLLVGNVAVNSLIAITSAELTSGAIGFIISTVLISIFGEVVPTILCSRFALMLGAKSVPMMKVAMVLFYVAAKPMALIIDWTFGEELERHYSKEEFTKLIDTHSEVFSQDKRKIMQGALHFSDATAGDVMTPMDKLYCLSSKDILSFETMSEIFRRGHSRIPVWNSQGTWIVGLLYAKDLILVSPQDELPVMTVITLFDRLDVPVVDSDANLSQVLFRMHTERVHFAVVRSVDDSVADRDPLYVLTGCITMEDILEQILQMDVEDEYDPVANKQGTKSALADMSRVTLLNLSGVQNKLDDTLAHAIAYTLLEREPVFSDTARCRQAPSGDLLRSLLKSSQLLHLSKPESRITKETYQTIEEEESVNMLPQAQLETYRVWKDNGVIVRKGSRLTGAIVVVEGIVEVTCGQDDIKSIKKAYDCVGQHALVNKDYVSDFDLCLHSQEATIIRLQRKDYIEALATQAPHDSSNGNRDVSHVTVNVP